MTPKPTQKVIAAALGIGLRRFSELKKQGCPDSSIAAALAWRTARENDDTTTGLRRERIGLVRAQRTKAEIENKRAAGELMPRAEVDADFHNLAIAMQGVFRALEVELPQLLLGLPLERSRPLVRAEIRRLQTLLSDKESEFWAKHPTTKG